MNVKVPCALFRENGFCEYLKAFNGWSITPQYRTPQRTRQSPLSNILLCANARALNEGWGWPTFLYSFHLLLLTCARMRQGASLCMPYTTQYCEITQYCGLPQSCAGAQSCDSTQSCGCSIIQICSDMQICSAIQLLKAVQSIKFCSVNPFMYTALEIALQGWKKNKIYIERMSYWTRVLWVISKICMILSGILWDTLSSSTI